MSFAFDEVPAVGVPVRVLQQGIAVKEVIFEVTSVFISVLESENSSLHLRQLKFAFKLLAIAEVEDTSALEEIVDKLALVAVPCSFVDKLALAVLAIQIELPLVSCAFELVH